MVSGNARGEDKRWTRSATENEIGSINAARAGPSAPLRSPTMTEAGSRGAKRAKRLGARERTREKRSVSPRVTSAMSASATERQQTHACATWDERSGSGWTRGNEIRDETRRRGWGYGRR